MKKQMNFWNLIQNLQKLCIHKSLRNNNNDRIVQTKAHDNLLSMN